MNSMLALPVTKLLQFQFRRPGHYTDICAVISLATVRALKPDIFPFALLFFSHKTFRSRKLSLPETNQY
jgi:hypothetical protein